MAAIPERWSPCRIDQTKGGRRHHCSAEHASLVEGFRLEQHAQWLRAETASLGYDTELAAYFGDDGAGRAVERRLNFRDWLIGSRRTHRAEAA